MLRNSKFLLAFLLLISAANAQSVEPPTCSISGQIITCPNGSVTAGTGSGTVTSVAVTTANGVSGSVATPTTTPAISLTLGAITPSSVAIGAGSPITSSGSGGALASGAFAAAYTLPTATSSVLGGVKPDGTTLTNTAGAISVTYGTAANTAAQGGVITAGGPTGNATTVPVITYNAAGQLTAVTTATVASAVTSQVVNTTRDLTTASGTQTLTFGFTPTSCTGFGAVNGGSLTSYTTLNSFSDSSANQAVLAAYSVASVTLNTSQFFSAIDSTAANSQTAVLSYGVNSVILTWTKTGTPTGTFSMSVRCFK